MTLQKQLKETLRDKDKALTELDNLKRVKKACDFNELNVHLEIYAQECERSWALLKDSLATQDMQ